ncbi:MAG: hypothetical protein Q7S21_06645 [archaeon]|nr:hypothetical protein [archaeon]
MFLVCETFVKKYLPAIRANTAKHLMEDYSYNQLQVSRALGITQPAVSKVLGKDFSTNINPKVMKQLEFIGEDYSKKIAENKETTYKLEHICAHCKERAKEEVVCTINRNHN